MKTLLFSGSQIDLIMSGPGKLREDKLILMTASK